MERSKSALYAFLILSAVSSFPACGPVDDNVGGTASGTVASDTNGNPTTGTVTNAAGFYVRAFKDTDITYLAHLDTTVDNTGTDTLGKSYTSNCSIADGTTGKDIYCDVEAKEEDLWFGGATLQYNVPTDMCNYVLVKPYWYYAMEPHYGIKAFTATLDDLTGGNGKYTAQIPLAGDSYVSMDSAGLVTCKSDYSKTTSLPNCCEGSYTITVTHTPATIPATVTTTNGDYGGKVGNCIDGPGSTLTKTIDGFPIYPETSVVSTGLNATYKIDPPQGLTRYTHQFKSNIYVANYMDVTNELNGNTPQAISPTAQQVTANYIVPDANRYYRFECYDRSFELINRINVQVRSWDNSAQWDGMNTNLAATQFPLCSATACPTCSTAPNYNFFSARKCWETKCPISDLDNLGGLGVYPAGTSCASDVADTEETPFGAQYMQDHLTWRSHYMYFMGKNNTYGGIATPANGLYPGVIVNNTPDSL